MLVHAPYLIASSFTTRPMSSRAVWYVKWECLHTLECRCAYFNGSYSGPYRHVPMLVVRYLYYLLGNTLVKLPALDDGDTVDYDVALTIYSIISGNS
jgi:hypothetical protein